VGVSYRKWNKRLSLLFQPIKIINLTNYAHLENLMLFPDNGKHTSFHLQDFVN